MSTPVHSGTPPPLPKHKRTPTNELQEQMQQLIRLQYEQQKHIQASSYNNSKPSPPPLPRSGPKKICTSHDQLSSSQQPKTAATATTNTATSDTTISSNQMLPNETKQQVQVETTTTTTTTKTATIEQQQQQQQQQLASFPKDPQVGQGTLLFPTTGGQQDLPLHRPIPRTASSNKPIVLNLALSEQEEQMPLNHHQQEQQQEQQQQQRKAEFQNYGSLQQQESSQPSGRNNNNTTTTGGGDASTFHYASLQQQEQQQQQQQQHDFQYGNPDYHDPYAPVDLMLGGPPLSSSPSHQQQHYQPSLWTRLCSCLWNPLHSCLTDILQSEVLHRSLCFGAIDGMLTGSGIVATFWGLHLLPLNDDDDDNNSSSSSSSSSSSDTHQILHTVVVLFCTAACFADAVCMALGHIWTAHVLASSQARERAQARQELQNRRANAKGQLVDMLLSKGMLKIDAMSLADTLEGYPDLFLAAVMGESLESAAVRSHQQQRATAAAAAAAHASHTGFAAAEDPSAAVTTGTTTATSLYQHHEVFPSYGRLMEADMDPDAVAVRAATSESRKESFFMMLGFSTFAILPSLLFEWIPILLLGGHNMHHHAGGSSSSSGVHPTSIVLTVMASIMWLLGVWKSHFLDSNWLLFGIEAVMVLFLCMASAYLVGSGLKKVFLPQDVVLQVKFTHFDLGY